MLINFSNLPGAIHHVIIHDRHTSSRLRCVQECLTSLVLTLRRIRGNNQLSNLQCRVCARQPLRHLSRVGHPFPMFGLFRIGPFLVHGHGTSPHSVASHVRVRHILYQDVPRLGYFPMHVARLGDEKVGVCPVDVLKKASSSSGSR